MAIDWIQRNWFNKRSKVVFFTGAGMSAESGIQTFRDTNGYWSQYNPMKLASPQGFKEDPKLVLEWYQYRREVINRTKPHAGHLAIIDFAKLFPHTQVITQNVDGFHQKSESNNVIELHGNIHRAHCNDCGKEHHYSNDLLKEGVPISCECGGLMRPSVVWFGESLNPSDLYQSSNISRDADVFFSIGTSSLVYPAAQMPYEAKSNGAKIIEINPNPTPLSDMADACIQGLSGEILPKIYQELYEIYH